ncbi:hypothetical protein ONS95_000407 [Cadophora gregata]|uniref:uncharacterized protein n=1 Tax=Cadophora gregata TaxID=51156 RepID=UPI0026DC329F|nr:uncharacterized protein ONS95_000407 [Cadophora gregata]KAK0125586.1 hypothetical protein ONS96_009422 [Cadophora gregata f. sp. sojae]KAK0128434.1 hypothetical protein ONS95_000407 [Cadophora gregata]
MAPFNKDLSQAPQAQAATPIHRDSVVSLELTQASPVKPFPMAHRHVMSAYTATLPRSAHPQTDGGNEGLPYNGWMSQFCVEPRGDISTCCLGFWVPCALYGKTHWRLKQIVRGKDASDSTWKSKNGCNTACWAWCGLASCLSMPISGIITGIQRAQIRGTYGIKGNCASDIALGMICPSCTQMQNDREIRAREGDVSMRYNPKYLKEEPHRLVNTQPTAAQPMVYNRPHLVSDHTTGQANQHLEAPPKLRKKTNPNLAGKKSHPDRQKCKVDEKKRPSARELESQRQAKKKALVRSAPKILVTQYQDEPSIEKPIAKTGKSSKKGGIFGKFSSTKQESTPGETNTAREILEPLSQQHTLVERDVVEIEDDTNNRKVQIEHALVDCTTVEHPSSEQSTSSAPQEHMIIECITVEEESPTKKEASGPAQHMIEECETVVVKSSSPSVAEEHRLEDCDTVPISEDEPPVQELSTSLPTELLQVNRPRNQHTLAECSEDENTPPSSPSRHRSTSYNIDRNHKGEGKSRQHRLVSCPTPPVLSHHVAENALTINSEDSQATQRPIYHDQLRTEEINKSADGISSGSATGSGETNSGGSTEYPANPEVVRRKRRRHKQHRKAIAQFPVTANSENKPVPVRSGSAQYSLEQVLAANGGKREKPQKSGELEKPSKQKGQDNESSAATAGGSSGQQSEGIRSEEDPRSPGVVKHNVTGL